jgi:hypothetical protein
VPYPGDKFTVHYDSDRLGASSIVPQATLGYFNSGSGLFVEVVAAANMIELESPTGTPTAIFAREFTIPSPAPLLGEWVVIVKAKISAVDRRFAFPIEVVKNPAKRLLAEFAGEDLEVAGDWIAHNIRQIRRVLDRMQLPQQLIGQASRDNIIAIVSSQLVETGETATFTFTIIDQEVSAPLNLEGATIVFVGEEELTAIGAWSEPCSIIDAEQGRCEANLPSAVTVTDGRFNGQVVVTLPSATVKKSQIFTVTIDPSVNPP